MQNKAFTKKTLLLSTLSLALLGCNSSNTFAPSTSTTLPKQLFLGGGHLVACSSMAQADCNDWLSYREQHLGEINDSDIRIPVDEQVAVSANYRARVLNAPAWASNPTLKQAMDNALQALDLQQQGTPFSSWNDFKAGMLALDASSINVSLEGKAIDGEFLWYDTSSEQWDSLAYLKMDDGLIRYTPTTAKIAAAQQHFATNSAVSDALSALTVGSTYEYIDFIHAFGESINSLDIKAQFALLRMFRDEVNYTRPLEYVALNESSSSDSVAAFKHFVEMAKTAANDAVPTILVATSSSDNNYDAADFYTAVIEQAGAKAQWFPLDRALRISLDGNNCDDLHLQHDVLAGKAHQDIYYADYADIKQQACEDPASLLAMIENAQGLFINGGSQLRSLQSFISEGQDSPEMASIRQRFEAGQLVIGGTSAGTAVQTGGQLHPNAATNPMIDGGSSHDVLRDGYSDTTMHASGGLGVFNWGITDTHFSERARETRLVTLAQQQGVRFGFGVDETTALIVTQEQGEDQPVIMQVVGQNGVYIADLEQAEVSQSQPLIIDKVSTHFINQGDSFTWYPQSQDYHIDFNAQAQVVAEDKNATTPNNDDVLYEDNYRQLAKAMAVTGASMASGESYENDPRYQLTLSRESNSETVLHNNKASYQHILLSLAPEQ